MNSRRSKKIFGFVFALGLLHIIPLVWARSLPPSYELVKYDAGSSGREADVLKEHIAQLHQVIACQQSIIEQARQGGLINTQAQICQGADSNGTQSRSTFNVVVSQTLGISSSALTALPPLGQIGVNVYLLFRGKADQVYKKDFLWPLLDLIANLDNIAYFLQGRYEMGRKEGNEDITSQCVAASFDIITMLLQAGIMYWQWRGVSMRTDYVPIQ